MSSQELRKALEALLEEAMQVYRANGKPDYEAGIAEGIKRALEVVE